MSRENLQQVVNFTWRQSARLFQLARCFCGISQRKSTSTHTCIVFHMILKFQVFNKILSPALKWQCGFPLQHSCGNRRKQNWSVWTMLLSGDVRSIYVEQQCSLAKDSEQTILRWIVARWHLNIPHHKVMSSLRIHIWYCCWVHISLYVIWGCFPIRNAVEINVVQVLHNTVQGWGGFLNHILFCFGSK